MHPPVQPLFYLMEGPQSLYGLTFGWCVPVACLPPAASGPTGASLCLLPCLPPPLLPSPFALAFPANPAATTSRPCCLRRCLACGLIARGASSRRWCRLCLPCLPPLPRPRLHWAGSRILCCLRICLVPGGHVCGPPLALLTVPCPTLTQLQQIVFGSVVNAAGNLLYAFTVLAGEWWIMLLSRCGASSHAGQHLLAWNWGSA